MNKVTILSGRINMPIDFTHSNKNRDKDHAEVTIRVDTPPDGEEGTEYIEEYQAHAWGHLARLCIYSLRENISIDAIGELLKYDRIDGTPTRFSEPNMVIARANIHLIHISINIIQKHVELYVPTWRDVIFSYIPPEENPEFTCYKCNEKSNCRYVYDLYNLNGDCLANK